jgi:hypothetical protein
MTYDAAHVYNYRTPTFKKDADSIWTEDERGDFCKWIAGNNNAGDVIPGSGGCRKVRWTKRGVGKRGGVRVIYYTKLKNGEIWLLVIYSKTVKENIPSHILKFIKELIDND